MEIKYKNNFDDLLALVESQLSKNKNYQKKRKWNLYGYPFALFCVFAVLSDYLEKPALYIGGVIGGLIYFFGNCFVYKNYPKKVVKQLQQHEVFCSHTLSISPEGAREKTESSETFNTWPTIHDVELSAKYIFIYNTPFTAHVIPVRELGETLFKEVSEEVMKYKNT